jgi:hypothetical protein
VSFARLAVFAGVVVAILMFVGGARAAATLVVLARTPAAAGQAESPLAAEIVHRMRGELVADGFRVAVVDPEPDLDRVGLLRRAASEARADVAAGLFVDGADAGIELVLLDAIAGRTSRRRPPAASDAPEPEVVARRAVDFLRASLLDFVVESLRGTVPPLAQPAPPPPPAPVPAAGPRSLAVRGGAEAGVGTLFGLGGVDPAIAPVLRARLELGPVFGVRLTGVWPTTRPSVHAAAGDAQVAQGVALVEGTATLWSSARLRFVAVLGAGAYYVAVHGTGNPPEQGQDTSTVAAAVDAGLGFAAPLAPHFAVVVEAHVLASQPGVAVRFAGVDAARVGRPTLLAMLTLAAWL